MSTHLNINVNASLRANVNTTFIDEFKCMSWGHIQICYALSDFFFLFNLAKLPSSDKEIYTSILQNSMSATVYLSIF